MLRIKPGVALCGLSPQICLALDVANEVYASHGYDECWVTSISDGKHSRGSLHYVGLAADLRTRDLGEMAAIKIVVDLRIALGKEFDVVRELDPPHIHLEYQPKGQ